MIVTISHLRNSNQKIKKFKILTGLIRNKLHKILWKEREISNMYKTLGFLFLLIFLFFRYRYDLSKILNCQLSKCKGDNSFLKLLYVSCYIEYRMADFTKFIDHYVMKSISTTLYLHLLQKGLYSKKKTKTYYLIALHFGKTTYTCLHALVKKMISQRNQCGRYGQNLIYFC